MSQTGATSRRDECPARRAWRAILGGALLSVCLFASAWAQGAQPPQQATYENPVIAGDFPDPSVIRVGEDYWATATTGGWAPHFPVLHSRDLVNWRYVGAVFSKAPSWVKGDFWAPEISEDRGRFYVYYTARRDDGPGKKGTLCVAVATADAPQGPYTDRGPVVCQDIGSIDAFALRDENDRRYLIWKEDGNDRNQPTPIWAQPLTEDGLKLTGKRKEILRNNAAWERHVTEGSFILRRGGWFYHFYSGNACCGRGCRYALGVARARKLLGPWEKNPANPILAANEEWQCPGHGDVVTTPDNRTFMLYHSYRQRADTFNVGREALLDEITWSADAWPAINGGKGPSSVAVAPLGAAERDDEAEVFEGFNSAQLDAAWQWPMYAEPGARVEVGGGGQLLLAPGKASASADEWTAGVVARRTTSGDYVATASVNLTGMASAARAGLSAFSWRDAAVGVAAGGGRVYVWRREGKDQKTLASADAPASPVLFLRMTASRAETYRFAFSANGRDWKELGDAVAASYIEGARVALTSAGPPGSVARFDWLRIKARGGAK
ncbi:MAG TPA: family 43 glycosylhydrolase [Pyrinomonadaceae bacterium]|nr:family 43 glycosylhydrolase [Pyrinomonadaceae bacterium]